jgi:hypothetical protein
MKTQCYLFGCPHPTASHHSPFCVNHRARVPPELQRKLNRYGKRGPMALYREALAEALTYFPTRELLPLGR